MKIQNRISSGSGEKNVDILVIWAGQGARTLNRLPMMDRIMIAATETTILDKHKLVQLVISSIDNSEAEGEGKEDGTSSRH